jgi:hypothetical protein
VRSGFPDHAETTTSSVMTSHSDIIALETRMARAHPAIPFHGEYRFMTRSQRFAFLLPALAVLAATSPAAAEPAASTCVYASRSYSDGAFLCVQKSVALICRSDGGRFTWATVADKDLADRCTTPAPYVHPHHARVRTAYRVHHRAPMISASKCFDFNGKHYCE